MFLCSGLSACDSALHFSHKLVVRSRGFVRLSFLFCWAFLLFLVVSCTSFCFTDTVICGQSLFTMRRWIIILTCCPPAYSIIKIPIICRLLGSESVADYFIGDHTSNLIKLCLKSGSSIMCKSFLFAYLCSFFGILHFMLNILNI